MTPDEMDAVFDRHAAAEGAQDLDALLDTLTEDAEHDVVGDPTGVLRGKRAISQRYRQLFQDLADEEFKTTRRYHGENFLVDDSEWVGRATGMLMGIPGENRPLRFRILHVCEFRDGKISRENVWLDVASIMQQLAPAT